MLVPGSNLLKMALSVLGNQTVEYYVNTGRTQNALGNWVANFADPVSVRGSFQPLQRSKYQNLGLDFQKNYFTFYGSLNVIDLTRDLSGDQLTFNGKRFQCESKVDWYAIDGWDGVLCVEISNA